MIRRLLPLLLCALAFAPAAAQVDPARPSRPELTETQRTRVDALAARAIAAIETLPTADRIVAANKVASAFLALGRCSAAESVVRTYRLSAGSLALVVSLDALDSDRACADRLITVMAESARSSVEAGYAPWNLYMAGMLWRRIGQQGKAEEAIAEADRFYVEEEARDPEGAWTCHGGDCLSSLWVVRLWALRLLRGTPHHRDELRWLATQALSHWYARETRRSWLPRVGQRLFEELLAEAVSTGDDRLAELLAERTLYGYPAAFAGERMRRLLGQGRVAEALELWPTAGRAFQAEITPALFRANLPLFHRWREQLRTRRWRQSGDWLSLLAAIWIERGEPELAREALATARAHHTATQGFEWDLRHVQRLRAVEAMLDGGGDPVDWIRRQGIPANSALPDSDYAFGELAVLLAATNRQEEARRALAAIRHPAVRHSTLVELPCRVAYASDTATDFAVGLASGHLRPLDRSSDREASFRGASRQTFLCLIRAHRGEAALAYVQAIEDPEHRLSLLIEMPLDSGISDEAALRRRFARLALEIVEVRNLWADRRVAHLAADLERVGDFARVERVLARARGETLIDVYERLLRVYAPARSTP